MHQQHSQAYLTREQRFNDRFPLSIVAILAIVQMLTTFGIFALEIAHISVNFGLTNLLVGLWASVPFTILWISMFAAVCCCRRRNCATHAVVQNVVALIFAGVLIGINITFIQRPDECFFTDRICRNIFSNQDMSFSFGCYSNDCNNTRMTLIKAQLGAGVMMAVTSIIYLILYFSVASRVARADGRQVPTVADAVMAPVYPQPMTLTPVNYQHQPYIVSSQAFQPSAPAMMPAYHQAPLQNDNRNHLPSNQYPGIYPHIPNDRF